MKTTLMIALAAMSVAVFAAGETNLALNKKATASSIEKKDCDAKFAVDGKMGTRWSSSHADNQWLVIDLGAEKNVGRVVINWETAAGKEYKLQISNDNKNWKDLTAVKNGKAGKAELKFNAQKGRYLRVLGQKRATTFGFSIFEIAAFEK